MNTLKMNNVQYCLYNIPHCHLPLSLRDFAAQKYFRLEKWIPARL